MIIFNIFLKEQKTTITKRISIWRRCCSPCWIDSNWICRTLQRRGHSSRSLFYSRPICISRGRDVNRWSQGFSGNRARNLCFERTLSWNHKWVWTICSIKRKRNARHRRFYKVSLWHSKVVDKTIWYFHYRSNVKSWKRFFSYFLDAKPLELLYIIWSL